MLKSKKSNNLLFFSKSFTPWFNLAVEEYLTAKIEPGQRVFYLWQNDNTVVIGSNQNPWKECRVGEMKDQGIRLARRQSGGGAVFHDKGNLNFTFIAPNPLFDTEKQFSVIINAVNSFGLHARFTGRNDIQIGNCKFSGNAFYSDEQVSYHHGTILINSDLTGLSDILTPSKQKIKSKGIDSVRSRVTNLKEFSPEITVETMKERLVDSFIQQYGKIDQTRDLNENSFQSKEFSLMQKKQKSWKWIYGDSPAFEAVHSKRFSWGEIEVGLNLVDGFITDTKIYSDSLITSFVKKLSKALTGEKYEPERIKKAIDNIDVSNNEKEIFSDIIKIF